MSEAPAPYEEHRIRSLIVSVRGQKVILDADLAAIFGVPTKRLNEQVKRNVERFPPDFVFRLTPQEIADLKPKIPTSSNPAHRSQIATGSQKHRDPRFRPYVFTEHGAIMAANVLNSPHAVQMSVFVVRAFVRMRGLLGNTPELTRRLTKLEKELKERLDIHESAIVSILQRVMDVIDPPTLPEPPRKSIGFRVKDRSVRYHVRQKKA